MAPKSPIGLKLLSFPRDDAKASGKLPIFRITSNSAVILSIVALSRTQKQQSKINLIMNIHLNKHLNVITLYNFCQTNLPAPKEGPALSKAEKPCLSVAGLRLSVKNIKKDTARPSRGGIQKSRKNASAIRQQAYNPTRLRA